MRYFYVHFNGNQKLSIKFDGKELDGLEENTKDTIFKTASKRILESFPELPDPIYINSYSEYYIGGGAYRKDISVPVGQLVKR